MTNIEVIGIDPGSQRTGWGIVREKSGVLELVECGLIQTKSATRNESFSVRLAKIYTELCSVIGRHNLDTAAIEQVFTAHNAQSALKLGQARGVAVAACAGNGLHIYDYEPTLVKKSIVGVGRAEKEQVSFMVKKLLNINDCSWSFDTTDALAVAICHLSHRHFQALKDIA